jgi:hypothetical protein
MGIDTFIRKLQSIASSAGIFLMLMLLAARSGLGQGSAQDRAQLLGNQPGTGFSQGAAPSGENQGYAVATPNDQDVGQQQILKSTEQYQPFSILVGSSFYYTSNVALVRNGVQDDFIVAPVVSAIYQPRIAKTFYGEFVVQQQFFLYDRFTEFNFASFDAIAGLVYYLPQFHNLMLRARYDYNRLTDTHYDEFFVDHSFFLNAEVPFQMGRAQLLSLGIDTNLSFAGHPNDPRRNDYEAYASYTVNLSRSFSVNAVGRVAVRDYYEGDRTDVSEILAVSANYRIRDWLTASIISTFAWNQSNHSVFDYSVANVGAGVAFTVKL